jgi:hypothetical protein
MQSERQYRALTALTWACASSPVLLLMIWIAMAIHLRLGLGHWPKPMVEDYKTFAFDVHEMILILVGYFAVFIALPLGLILVCFKRFRGPMSLHIRQAATFVVGWALIVLFARLDPTTFTDWFMD